MKKNFTELDIKNAILHTRSYFEAARYLKVTYLTFRKYAKLYGLWEHGGKNKSGHKLSKLGKNKRFEIQEILGGKYNGTKIKSHKIKQYLILELLLEEKCDICGFSEKRDIDKKVPLWLDFKDGNRRNYRFDNLRLLCFNCYFLYGNIGKHEKVYFSNPITGEIIANIDFGSMEDNTFE